MKVTRKIIEIDEDLCDGCGNCIISCAEGALEIVDGKARLTAEKYCDGLGACLGECPTGALQVIDREAEEFDEIAVEHHLENLKKLAESEPPKMPCGCPSSQIRTFAQRSACQSANIPMSQAASASGLAHWPVQISLVPATAPFLKNAELLVAADCTPVAYPDFHRNFLQGKVVMLGCPKFDDVQSYLKKFGEIFSVANIRSVSVVVMEVPCCHGMPVIVKKAMDAAGKAIPMEIVTIGVQGQVLNRERTVA